MLVVKKAQRGNWHKVKVSNEQIEEMNNLIFGEIISTDRGMRKEVPHMLMEERKAWGMMGRLWKEK